MKAGARPLALCAVAAATLFLGGSQEAPAQGEGHFERIDFKIGGRITEVLFPDLDGDGQRDLFVVRGREALVFFQGEGGRWSSEPNQRFRFHPRTILFDVADLDGDGRAEVVLIQKEGVFAYVLQDRGGGRLLYGLRPKRVVESEGFFSRPMKKEVRRKQFLRDVDSDGDIDLLLPQTNGFYVLANDGKGAFADARKLAAPPSAVLHLGRPRLSSQLFASYWFPNPNVVQWDATGAKEVVLARNAEISVFGSDVEGGLPLQLRETFTIPEQKQLSMSVQDPLELDFNLPIQLLDLDADGRVDVSTTHVGKGTTRLYRNREGSAREVFKVPTTTLRAKGVTFLAYYVDMNGDGLLDLVMPRMDDITVWAILKVLVTRSVPIELLIFYQRKDSFFGAEPDVVRDLEIPVSLNSSGDKLKLGTSVCASVDGDFNGDGKKDLVFRADSDTLDFFGGRAGNTLDEEPFATARIADVDAYRFSLPIIVDINADGRDDVFVRYWSWNQDDDQLTLLRSRAK